MQVAQVPDFATYLLPPQLYFLSPSLSTFGFYTTFIALGSRKRQAAESWALRPALTDSLFPGDGI